MPNSVQSPILLFNGMIQDFLLQKNVNMNSRSQHHIHFEPQ